MITEFAYQFMKAIAKSVTYSDKWAGLVVPMKKMVNKTEKIIPVAINSNFITNSSDYIDLIPNSSRMSIMYCERLGLTTTLSESRNYSIMATKMRIVVWYNCNLMNAGEWIDEGIVATNFVNGIPRRFPNTDLTYIKNVAIFNPIIVHNEDIFAKYTYDEVRTQYTTFPYGSFAVDVELQYTHVKCAETIIPAPSCAAPYVGTECTPNPA
jgi:hypothetical protein